MRITKFLPVVLASILGCTTQGGADGDSLPTGTVSSDLGSTCSTDNVYPLEWFVGNTRFTFPESVHHLENIQVRWDATSFYAWGIGDGQVVTYAFHVKYTDQSAFNKAMIDAMPTAGPSSLNSQTWGVQGVGGPCCGGGGPIGPGPIGFPPIYVKRLAQFAGTFTDGATFGNQTMGQYAQYAIPTTLTIIR